MADTQISAYISESTKHEVERYVEAHGVKKGHLVEEALLHHLQALRELPADIVIPRGSRWRGLRSTPSCSS